MPAVEGATFLLFCHDDVVLGPDAVGIMVEEAYRSNAGIVGPKLVDYDHPDILLEVGMAVDHYGVPFSGIEPGEVDQEQHDAVRDVFYVSDAAMLVRADLFHELGGFDPATFPGSDDLDLCWRARLAGARVLVAPDAPRPAPPRDGPGRAADAPQRPGRPAGVVTQSRIRVLTKSYSALALVLGAADRVRARTSPRRSRSSSRAGRAGRVRCSRAGSPRSRRAATSARRARRRSACGASTTATCAT